MSTTVVELVEGSVLTSNERDNGTPVNGHVQTTRVVEIRPKVEKKGATTVIISTITGITFISSLLSGLITISLPTIARDLAISEALLLW